MTKKVYVNKNGNMEIVDFVRLIHNGEYDSFIRGHRVSDQPCPPMKLIDSKQMCFYCFSCFEHCKKQIKENKDYYVVNKKKYMKSDLDE